MWATNFWWFVGGFCLGTAFGMLLMVAAGFIRVKHEFEVAAEKLKRWRVIGR